jgi:hypothetical protein
MVWNGATSHAPVPHIHRSPLNQRSVIGNNLCIRWWRRKTRADVICASLSSIALTIDGTLVPVTDISLLLHETYNLVSGEPHTPKRRKSDDLLS